MAAIGLGCLVAGIGAAYLAFYVIGAAVADAVVAGATAVAEAAEELLAA